MVKRVAATVIASQVIVLACVCAVVGLSFQAWLVGLTFGAVVAVAISRGLARSGAAGLGPANWVTLARATLIGVVAGLVAQSFARSFAQEVSVPTLIGLCTIALVLDAVDGQVARRTGSVSNLGARFDMEADAFLIFVLSIYVSQVLGWWVITIGIARYLFVAFAWVKPWLRRPLPYRTWRKVAAAIQGIVLTVAASTALSQRVSIFVVVASLVVLAESFMRDVQWLFRRRSEPIQTQLHIAACAEVSSARSERA